MVDDKLLTALVETKLAADALMEVAGGRGLGLLEVLRLSAMLVEGRAALVVGMLELMMAAKGGGTESESAPEG